MGWPMQAGLLGWAAHTAQQLGLSCPREHGWAFIDLVHWRVDQVQVHLHHPGTLNPDENQALLRSMSPYFLEDGIHLHAFEPGRWLAHSTHFQHLPSASLDQVMGRSMAAWLNTDELAQQNPTQRLLRRLQNEMQMLLYTHPVNEGRSLAINSFWVHGTGALPALPPIGHEPAVVDSLRESALQQDFIGWLEAWQHVDAQVIGPQLARVAAGEPQRLVLCGEHEFHVYDSATPSLWQRVRTHFAPTSLNTVLAVAPLKD